MLGVSGDSVRVLETFSEKHGIPFPLISDTGGRIKSLYSNKRINYLIDKNGVIRMIQNGIPKNNLFLERLRILEK